MATYTDNFNRANSNDLVDGTHPWAEFPAADPQIRINGNEVEIDNPAIGGASGFHARYDDVIGVDQYSQARLTYLDANSFGALAVRAFLHTPTGTYKAYMLGVVDFGANQDIRIFPDNDISGPIASFTVAKADARSWAVGRTVKLQIVGSTLKAFTSGTEIISVVHTGYTTGKPGFGAPGGIAGSRTNFDDWEGGDVPGPPLVATVPEDFTVGRPDRGRPIDVAGPRVLKEQRHYKPFARIY